MRSIAYALTAHVTLAVCSMVHVYEWLAQWAISELLHILCNLRTVQALKQVILFMIVLLAVSNGQAHASVIMEYRKSLKSGGFTPFKRGGAT